MARGPEFYMMDTYHTVVVNEYVYIICIRYVTLFCYNSITSPLWAKIIYAYTYTDIIIWNSIVGENVCVCGGGDEKSKRRLIAKKENINKLKNVEI